MELCIILSGDIHPLPVQDNETRKTIYRHKKINVVTTRGHNKSNCTSVPLLCVQSLIHGKPLFLWKSHAVVLARNNSELDTAVDNYGSLTLRRLNTANEPCVVAIQWKLVLLKIRKKKWFKCRVNFYSNSDATFNVMELCIERSGDVHPMPGPSDNCTSEIPVRISSRGYNNGNLRLKGTSLCNRNMTNLTKIQRLAHCLPKVTTCCLKFCLINTRSVRNKTMVVKDFAVDNDVDILVLTETWLRPGNIDDIDVGPLCPTGYRFLHVPRSQGRGGGVGVLFKDSLDVNTSVTDSFETFEFMDVRSEIVRALEF